MSAPKAGKDMPFSAIRHLLNGGFVIGFGNTQAQADREARR